MTRNYKLIFRVGVHALVCIFALASFTYAAKTLNPIQDDEGNEARKKTANAAVRQLTDRDPLVRQRAAEELARLAAVEQRKLVEGYRLQEKNRRVGLALDWALYRMGKAERLFALVRALDSSSSEQARSYLIQLESPEPLYMFLETAKGRTLVGLLEVFARTGDEDTLRRIKSYIGSTDPKVAEAARFAEREISLRLAVISNSSIMPLTLEAEQNINFVLNWHNYLFS